MINDDDDDFQKENHQCDTILIGLIISNFMYGCNMMAVFNFLPLLAEKKFKITPDNLSISLSAYELSFLVLPFIHGRTMLCLGRKNALILNFVVGTIHNIMFAYLEKC